VLLGFQPLLLGGRGNVFCAYAAVTAPGLYSTAAGTGGPLLYNGTASGHGGVTAYIMALGYGLSVAAAAAGAIGLTGGPTTAPTSTTPITTVGNLQLNGPASLCTAYSIGTPSAPGTFFMPTGQTGTGGVTVDTADDNFIHLGGVIAVPPGYFCSVAASAVLTSAVMQVSLIWLELPND